MSEAREEDCVRAARLYTVAQLMKNARLKELEEQAMRKVQEAQRPVSSRHRIKKKRCLDENVAREISKIAELSKVSSSDAISHMSEMNINKISAELKQMMERGKVPEHIVQMAQLAEFNKINSDFSKMSQELAKRYEMEKMAEYAKTTEYMKMQEMAKMNEMVKFSEMAKYNDITKMNEMMKMSQMSMVKINEVQRMNEIAKLNEMVKMTEMAKYNNDITNLNEIAQINEVAKEIVKMNEKTKLNEMAIMKMTNMQNDIAKSMPEYSKMANEMAKLTELAKLNEITITKLNDPPTTATAPPPPLPPPMSKMSEIQPPPPPPRIPEPVITVPNPRNLQNVQTVQMAQASPSSMINFSSVPGQNNYGKLLAIIEELGRDIRLSYAGSRSAAERLKNGIQQARIIVRECLLETQHNAQQ